MKFDLTISIVLYNNDISQLQAAIDSALNTKLRIKLYLVDNSPTDKLRYLSELPHCEYIYNNKNLGFGKGHNVALKRSVDEATYHLVLNPDVYFGAGVLEKIFEFMEQHPDVGHLMPKVHYPDGKVQHLCKLLPAPADLFLRRFLPWFPGATRRNRAYELLGSGYNKIMNIPFLSGCFMFLRTSALKEVGYFDDRIFMYIEDADLTRRVHQKYKTIFYPEVIIYHHFGKGSYKSLKLMLYNIHGAMVYFNKWGWIFDPERRRINNEVLKKYIG